MFKSLRFSFLLLFALLASSAAWAGTQVQSPGNNSCLGNSSNTTCTVTLTQALTANHAVLIYTFAPGDVQILSVTDNGSTAQTYTVCSCRAADATAGSTSLAYVLNTTSVTTAATTITVTVATAPSNTWSVKTLELSAGASSISIDNGGTFGTTDDSTAATAHTGATLSISGSNDTIVRGIKLSSGSSTSAISAPYKLVTGSVSSGGLSYAGNTNSGAGPTWTTTSSRGAELSAALNEVCNSGTVCASPLDANGSSTATNSFTTDSLSNLGTNYLVLAAVVLNCSSANCPNGPTAPAISGDNLTWVLRYSITFGATQGTGKSHRLDVFSALGSPTSGTLTIATNEIETKTEWTVDEFRGVNTSGTNGSGALGAASATGSGTATSSSVTMGSFANSLSATYALSAIASAITITPMSTMNMIEFDNSVRSILTQFNTGNIATPTSSWSGSLAWGAVGVELKPAANINNNVVVID